MRRVSVTHSVFIVLIVSWPLFSFGEEQPLGEVTVRPPSEGSGTGRTSEAGHDSVSFSTVITDKDLEGRRTSLPELLEEESGVQIRRYGGLDDFATVSIRGSTSEQVAIYLDGVLLNQGMNGVVNIATIPVDQIGRIEVYKGSAPVRFGSSAIGGVVNIVTKKAGEKRETRLLQSYGSFGTYEGTLLHSQKMENFTAQAAYTFQRSAGDFSFQDNNGTPFNASDDRITERVNNEFLRHNLSTKLSYSLPGGNGLSIGFQNQFFREDRGIPGLATLTSEVAGLSTLRNGSSFEFTKKEIAPGFNLTLSPFFQFQKSQLSDPRGEIGLGTIQDNDDDTFQYGSNLRGYLLIGGHQRLSLLLEYRGEQFLPEDFSNSPSAGPHSIRNSFSGALEDEIILFGERLVFNPSLRTEHIVSDLAGGSSSALHPVSGKIGVKFRPREAVTLRTNFSRSYRIPNFSELFGDQGTFFGNPGLKPESGWNWDLGAAADFKVWRPVRLEVSYFRNQIADLIQLLQTSQFTIQAQNLSSALIQGIETGLFIPFFKNLDLTANYTFQRAKDASGLPGLDGKFLPGRPVHELNVRGGLHNGWGKLFADLVWMDDNYLDTQNIQKVNDRLFLSAGASVRFLKRFTTSLEAKNLLNNRVSDVVGFPLPGRSYYGKLEIKI